MLNNNMDNKDIFTRAGFSVFGAEDNASKDKLISFLKENYPQVISDNEIKLDELKSVINLPIDEKVNGYGLNFVGRNVARAKYKQKTTKELKINTQLSLDFDNTQNMVLKGDNIDCLKILKSYYNEQIKCIYIDPPYNTDSDNFIYPDKFDKEEQEVLGLANLTENDMDRLEFSFKTKKSHNGWLTFMYPRLKLAYDLLSKDGVIFVSIDDNEQADLKLLMDEVFDEENFVADFPRVTKKAGKTTDLIAKNTDYILCYRKTNDIVFAKNSFEDLKYNGVDEYFDDRGNYKLSQTLDYSSIQYSKSLDYEIKLDGKIYRPGGVSKEQMENRRTINPQRDYCWRWSKDLFDFGYKNGFIVVKNGRIYTKTYKSAIIGKTKAGYSIEIKERKKATSSLEFIDNKYSNDNAKKDISTYFDEKVFEYSKPISLIKKIVEISTTKDDIILDFFAGSGTTADAVMQLNIDEIENDGNRKFILCQIDEHINKDKPAYKFCVENKLPPCISSITCERIKRAGDKIKKEIEEKNAKAGGIFKEHKQQVPDIGFKVFDLVDAPKLTLNDGQVSIQNTDNDPLSRIYNMIFQVGIDDPMSTIECILDRCMYKIANNYYITNAAELDKEENKHFLSDAIKDGKVFIDGWTASINATLQNYKEDVKIVF